jgi:hypothetical protein
MEDKIFECEYVSIVCNRRYQILIFGVQTENDGALDWSQKVVLPPSVISLKNIDYGQYDVPYGMPSGCSAELTVNIEQLDLQNTDHELFIEMCINPNKWKLRPTVIINEISTNETGGQQFHFVGKIAVGGADGISLDQTELTLKVPQIYYYVLSNMSVPHYKRSGRASCRERVSVRV